MVCIDIFTLSMFSARIPAWANGSSPDPLVGAQRSNTSSVGTGTVNRREPILGAPKKVPTIHVDAA
jgi:hypothetical protein